MENVIAEIKRMKALAFSALVLNKKAPFFKDAKNNINEERKFMLLLKRLIM
ncbi:MAG: hypothetical protein ACJAVY_001335 [Marinoscillum sp.]|jgi:hypothetical protein